LPPKRQVSIFGTNRTRVGISGAFDSWGATTMGFSFTGAGWITGLLAIFSTFLGLGVGFALSGGELLGPTEHDVAVTALAMSVTFVGAGLLNGAIGRPLNTTTVDGKRMPSDRHTFNGIPMQYCGVIFYTLAGLAVVVAIWVAANPWVAVASAIVLVIGLFVRAYRRDNAKRATGLDDRPGLAAERGWRYVAQDYDFAKRMVTAHGRAARSNIPFGIMAGEIDGVPFTAFDTRFGFPTGHGNITEPHRRTTWLVHLPVNLPAAWVLVGAQSDGSPRLALTLPKVPGVTFWLDVDLPFTRDRLAVADCEDEAFAGALLTPRVAEVTELYQLDKWQLAGRDLVYSVDRDDEDGPLPAADVAATADRLVVLATAVTDDLADRFGSPPDTDVPFRAVADARDDAAAREEPR
jgi:hypothetical protein